MKIIDLKLLQFNDYLKINPFYRSQAAKALDISERQLIRYLNKWHSESFIDYTNGVGRGNHSYVQINMDIEQYFVNEIINNIYDLSIEDIEVINTYPFSPQSKNIINSLFNQAIHHVNVQENERKIMDYIYRIPEHISPIGLLDIAVSIIIFNTMDRLYELNEDGVTRSNIVAYDEWTNEGLMIHLYQDIYFSNGHLLFAENVAECLKLSQQHRTHQLSLQLIKEIEVINEFTLLLKMDSQQENIKYILSQPHMSIYKSLDEQCIGTGVYYVDQHTTESIVLKANSISHHAQPDVSEVILVSDLHKYQQYFDMAHLSYSEHEYFHKINFIIFNPSTSLDINQRSQLHNYFYQFMTHQYEEEGNLSKVLIQPIPLNNKVTCPHIKMLVIESFKNEQYKLYDYLKQQGFNIDMVETDFTTFLKTDVDDWDVDFIWLNEASPEIVLLYNLLATSKFSDWLLNDKQGQKTLKALETNPISEWQPINEYYYNYLNENVYLSILSHTSRRYFVEKEYKNLVINPYGVMLYDQLIHE